MLRFLFSCGILLTLLPCYAIGVACVPGLCQNGGSCHGDIFWYVCSCGDGFIGRNCENTHTGPVDASPPILVNCPSDIVETTTLQFDQTVWTDPTAFDGSDTYLIFQSHFSHNYFATGSTTVTYIYADDFGNIANCTFDVTFIRDMTDMTPPTLTYCPEDIHTTTPAGRPEVPVFWEEPRAEDEGGGPVTITKQNAESGQNFPVNTQTNVLYEFSDSSGNVVQCSFKVVVTEEEVDNTPPTITNCPSDLTLTPDPVTGEAVADWIPPSAGDDSGTVFLISQPPQPGESFPAGSNITVVYMYSDLNRNFASCIFHIIVQQNDESDNTPPTITKCPTDITLTPDPVTGEAVADWTPPSVGDDSGTVFLISQPPQPGTSFPAGSNITVDYTYSDLSRNFATCAFHIIIQETNELVPLTLICPEDIQVMLDGDQEAANVTWVAPTVPSAEYLLVSTRVSGTLFPPGVTIVRYFAQGPEGDDAGCSFNVEVLPAPTPTFVCPPNVLMTIGPDEDSVTVDWDEPAIVDPGIFLIGSMVSGSSFPVGVTEVAYQLYGATGLEAECAFLVEIVKESARDTTPPEIMDCPTDAVTVVVQPGVTSAVVTWREPTAVDESGHVSSEPSASPGDVFVAGVTSVHYQFGDESGNVATCTFDVEVEVLVDTSPPSISNCPSDVQVYVLPGSPDPTVEWNIPSAADDYSAFLATRESHQPGHSFPRGQSTVTYTFEDQSENVASCSFQIIVSEIPRPTVSMCPAPINIGVEVGLSGDTVSWAEPHVTSVLTVENRHISHNPGSFFPLGESLVSYNYTFVEVEDLVLSCNFTVNVFEVDQIPPAITYCPGNIHKLTNSPTDLPMIQWKDPTAEDNSGNLTVGFQSHVSGSPFAAGITEVVHHFMDSSRNVAECRFTVTVEHVSAAVVVPVTFRIDEEFSTSLMTRTSHAYRNLTGKLENEVLDVVMSRRQLRNTFGGINIVQLKPGSVIVETDLWFHTVPEVNDIPAFIENLFNARLDNDRIQDDLEITAVSAGKPSVVASKTTQHPATERVMPTDFEGDTLTDGSTDIPTDIVQTEDPFGPNKPIAGRPGGPVNASSLMILVTIAIVVVTASVLVSLATLIGVSCRSCSQRMMKKEQPRREKSSRRRADRRALGTASEIPDGPNDDSDDAGGVRFIRISQDFDIQGVGVEHAQSASSDDGSSSSESSINVGVSMVNVV